MSSKETLLILGGGLQSRPALASLKEHGYRLVVVDGDPDADCFSLADVCGRFDFRDFAKCSKLARKENVKAVIPTHDRAVLPTAQICEARSLIGPSKKAAEIATSKVKMRRAWLEDGLPSPEFAIANSFKEFQAAVARIGLPAICKPTGDVGGGSRGIQKIDENSNLEEAYEFATSFSESDKEVLLETFYEGLEHSVEVFMRNGKAEVLMVSDKVKTPPPYRVDKSVIYPTKLNASRLHSIKNLSAKAVKAVGLVDGAAHLELCTLPDGGNMLFEIGLRCGGGATPHPIAELVTGINQIVEYAEILLGRKERDITPKYSHGASFHFITAQSGVLKSVEGFESASKMPGIISSCLTVGKGDTIYPLKTSSQRLGYFVTAGKNREEALLIGATAEKHLRFIYEEQAKCTK